MKRNAGSTGRLLRLAPWLVAALLLLAPLVAMRLTDEVDWEGTDFAVMGGMLLAACATWELAARMTGNATYRAAAGLAIVTAFLLTWVNLAVGIIGSEDHRANPMYGGVLAVAAAGAIVAGFRSFGMALALVATSVAQMAAGAVALIAGLGSGVDVLGLTGPFAALWLASAWLFRKAAAASQGYTPGRRPWRPRS